MNYEHFIETIQELKIKKDILENRLSGIIEETRKSEHNDHEYRRLVSMANELFEEIEDINRQIKEA